MMQSRSRPFLLGVVTLAIGVLSLFVPKSVSASGCLLDLSHWEAQAGCNAPN
jgi:hypothetical protein